MNRIMAVAALSGAILVGARAPAAEPENRSTLSKRQMYAQIVDCMKKRMSANKNGSYIEAMKACKDQVNQGNSSLPSGALVASDTPAKQ